MRWATRAQTPALPYVDDEAWSEVEQIPVDRAAEDAAGMFGKRVAALRAEVVVDMICHSLQRHGPAAWRQRCSSPATSAGPGWSPIGPLGNLDPSVWYALSAGQEIAVPGLGAELMHQVHADDVAQAFQLAIEHRDAAAGESFNVVARSALAVRGFLAIAAGWFGQSARTLSVSWADFRSGTTAEFGDSSWQHCSRSQFASIEKARMLLGYAPAFEPEAAVLDGICWLIDQIQLEVANPLVV
jgi:hypothetical protein